MLKLRMGGTRVVVAKREEACRIAGPRARPRAPPRGSGRLRGRRYEHVWLFGVRHGVLVKALDWTGLLCEFEKGLGSGRGVVLFD